MLSNDYNKQYERRQRIKRTTLVVGIDVGADFNAVGFIELEHGTSTDSHKLLAQKLESNNVHRARRCMVNSCSVLNF